MPEQDSRQGTVAAEGSDIHPQRVLAVAGFILLALVVVVALVAGLLDLWQMPFSAGPNAPRAFQPAGPRLLAAPQDERAAYFAEKEKRLHTYEWVDRQAGTARIPIEVAMELLAARTQAQGGRP